MRFSANHCCCVAACWLGIGLALGCGQPPRQLADATPEVDAGSDASVEPTPLRALGSRGLFGQTPVENRVFDPTFAQIDGVAWSPFHPVTYDVCPVTRLHQRTPGGQPAVRLERPAGQSNGQLVGMAKGAPGPMEASVWLGRFEGTNLAALTVSLYGLFPGGDSAVELVPEAGATPLVLDGVSWLRFRVYLADGPLSWAYLRVVNKDIAPLFVTAPVFMRVSAQARWLGAPRLPAVHRPLLPEERATWRDWQRRLRERFGGPARPQTWNDAAAY